MKRRDFFTIDKTNIEDKDEVVIERPVQGKPHQGKVLAAIQPHCDDIPILAAGTVAKLLSEGYTGYLIRTTNDDAAGSGNTYGEVVRNNERDTDAVAKALGLKKVFNLNYRNHSMDEYNIQEIKSRLIFLIRLLKIDTVICYDSWAPYENNPDHYITGRAVDAAITPAGLLDYPEQLEVLKSHQVLEKYFFIDPKFNNLHRSQVMEENLQHPQHVNRVVDISPFIDTKVEANMVNITQGPAGHSGSQLRKRLAAQGKRLPILGDDDRSADFNFIKHFILERDKLLGAQYGLEWAEAFHYIGPIPSVQGEYIQKNAVSL